jgi:hypothetical protein
MSNPANEHEETIRAHARCDVETLGARRPRWQSVVEVHTERAEDEPPGAFEIAREALGDAFACGTYFAEFDRVLSEIASEAAPLAAPGPTVNMVGEGGRRVPARALVDRSMLPHGEAAWQLQWVPRVRVDADDRRAQLDQLADILQETAPRADDGTACASIAYEAIGSAFEVQIGLVCAALTAMGRQPARPALEAARAAAADLAFRLGSSIGFGLGGPVELNAAIKVFADALADLHRSGVQ